MPDPNETLPNYDKHDDSPAMKEVGLAVAVVGKPRIGAPVVLRGTFTLDGHLARQIESPHLVSTMLIVVRRDKAMGRVRPVKEGHNMIPPRKTDAPVDPSLRISGYFNVDLVAFTGFLTEPGRYWAMAALGDLVSNRVEFDVAPK